MEISEYENIEIFINTQGFDINKYENQILRHNEQLGRKFILPSGFVFSLLGLSFERYIIYLKNIFRIQLSEFKMQLNIEIVLCIGTT
jgi:hypothetical protein